MKYFDKKGLELAANTIVLLIVGVVILTLAISLSYGVFCSAEEYSQQVDAQSQQQLERLLAGGGKVRVADNSKRAVRAGSAICGSQSGYTAEFTLGIQNQESYPADYYIEIQAAASNDLIVEWQHFPEPGEPVTIPQRDTHTTNILFSLPAQPASQQIYTVRVLGPGDSGTLYGVQQLYINP